MKRVFKIVFLFLLAVLNIVIFVDGAFRLAEKNPIIKPPKGLPDVTGINNFSVGVVEIVISGMMLIAILLRK